MKCFVPGTPSIRLYDYTKYEVLHMKVIVRVRVCTSKQLQQQSMMIRTYDIPLLKRESCRFLLLTSFSPVCTITEQFCYWWELGTTGDRQQTDRQTDAAAEKKNEYCTPELLLYRFDPAPSEAVSELLTAACRR